MLAISATTEWAAAHPGGVIGLLELSGVDGTGPPVALDARKRETEQRLRERYRGFARPAFLALPVMAAYAQYYRRFGKTYHVLQQVESIVLKDRGLPTVSPLVDANFMAEMDTLVLTAGHDADRLEEPVAVDVARAGDGVTQMTGTSKAIPAGDMVMRDARGVCCSILYGQDDRSPISPATRHVLYVAYAPAGVGPDAVAAHLELVERHVRLVAPHAALEQRRVVRAGA
jgi:DNA/RNA-binding domain of Phe-tRNA-synthetase-like protein